MLCSAWPNSNLSKLAAAAGCAGGCGWLWGCGVGFFFLALKTVRVRCDAFVKLTEKRLRNCDERLKTSICSELSAGGVPDSELQS